MPPLVVFGASAGGLETFFQLIEATPADSGMAFVLIQHLDPEHPSLLPELLGARTRMKVAHPVDGEIPAANCVYVIPPGMQMTMRGGSLRLARRVEAGHVRMPIDTMFRSLAESLRERAIGVVLSGTGTDGTLGAKAIKEHGGLVIAQDPAEAIHAGMPRSAIAHGVVDLVLPVAKMPEAVAGYADQHYYRASATPVRLGEKAREALPGIVDYMREHSPVDFAHYREGTLLRRIERRMGLQHIDTGLQYLRFLHDHHEEVEQLARDLLISVTGFFRDPEVFRLLESDILPELVRRQPVDEPIRAWVAGCASGEEAYSLAMLFAEQLALGDRRRRVQIFASDIDGQALAIARAGVYPDSIEAEVPKSRLARFFLKEDHTYRALPELREMIIFADHNLLGDAPFSHLDLVLCRNVFIYFNGDTQKRVLALFNFALREHGVLVLGGSETIGDQTDLFEPISMPCRVYRRVGPRRPAHLDLPLGPARRLSRPAAPPRNARPSSSPPGLAELTRRSLVEHFAPASVLVNAKHECLYFSGALDAYLKVPSGAVSSDLATMLRGGLASKVRAAIAEAARTGSAATRRDAFVGRNGERRRVRLAVHPVDYENARLMLVSFTPEEPVPAPEVAAAVPDPSAVSPCEQELDATRRELQATICDLKQANEALEAAHEIAMSINEEFQSTNEELETSREELQSLNEELTTLNHQLQEKVEEQRRTTNDLENLLTSSEIATVFLDRGLRIVRFTRTATRMYHLVATDIGRPFADIRWKIQDPELIAEARSVLDTQHSTSRDVLGADGCWYTRRILPYRTQAGTIEGVVVTLQDVSDLKAAQHRAETARSFFENIVDTVREPLIVLDRDLKVVTVNRAYRENFGGFGDAVIGQSILEAEDCRWDLPQLRELLLQVIPEQTVVENYAVDGEVKGLGHRKMLLNARRVRLDSRESEHLLLAIFDITEHERRRAQLEERTTRLTALLDAVPDAVINISEQGRIGSFSRGAEHIFGYTEAEVLGENVRLLMPEPDRGRHDAYLAHYVATGERRIIGIGREVTGRRKDGSLVPLMLNVTESRFDHVRVFTGVLRDLTEQKHTEDQLRQSRKMEVMGQLVGGVAHDFNNLLTVISGNLEMLEARLDRDDDRELLEDARGAARTAATLTGQMLAFSRRQTLHPAQVEINPLVLETADMVCRMLDATVRVSTVLGKDVGAAFVDEASLRAALLNLAVNARDAMPDGGQLSISTRSSMSRVGDVCGGGGSPCIAIAVSDTGIGMTPEVVERAIEPFFTTKAVGKGSGLGLAMVYGFVKQSGGDIEIQSEPGRGTTVTIHLPESAGGRHERPGAPKAPATIAYVDQGKHILVVEDDERVRKVAVRQLRQLGYTVTEAEHGPAALALLDTGQACDLLLTDMVMPEGMSGADLARAVRQRRPNLPVLFVTGYAPDQVALGEGDIVLQKPYSAEELAQKVRAVLDAPTPSSR